MAHSPQKAVQKSQKDSKFAELVADGLAKGKSGPEIARLLAKGDEALAKKYRSRIREMAYRNPGRLKEAIARQAQGDMLLGLPGSVNALNRRAHKGNVPAIKLHLEASGLHNPRVKHEHSGEIKVTMDIPRPTMEQDALDIPEADVIED